MEQQELLTSIIHFSAYFGLSLIFVVVFKFIYALVTPHDEWKLIKEEKNIAAAKLKKIDKRR